MVMIQDPPRRTLRATPLDIDRLDDTPITRAEFDATVLRNDKNFILIDQAIGDLKRRPPKTRRTHSAAAARINPDQFWFGMVILALNAVFAFGALAASFTGQYELAAKTHLPQILWWVVPAAIDLPIMSAAFTGAVFRKRKQGTVRTWSLMIALTVVSTVVNVTRVLDQDRYFHGASLSVADWVGAGIMGLMPSLVLVTWENLARLLIKPTGEARPAQQEKPPAPTRRPARTQRSTK